MEWNKAREAAGEALELEGLVQLLTQGCTAKVVAHSGLHCKSGFLSEAAARGRRAGARGAAGGARASATSYASETQRLSFLLVRGKGVVGLGLTVRSP